MISRQTSPSLAVTIVGLLLFFTVNTSALQADERQGSLAEGVGIDQNLDAQLPLDLAFRDETGREVQLKKYFRGKPVIVSLVYYRCPMLCTQVLNGLLRGSQGLQFQMGQDYDVITVSFDPSETPTQAAKKKDAYVKAYRREGAKEGWHFLTGSAESIEALAKTVGFRYRYDELTQQYAHASGIVMATPEGRISKYFYGIDYSPHDLRLGLFESGEGKIGSAVDQILLLCYHYDPRTGRYGLVISGILKTLCGVTALGLGGFLLIMFRREWRVSRQANHRQLHGNQPSTVAFAGDADVQH
jgi:protein SCO1